MRQFSNRLSENEGNREILRRWHRVLQRNREIRGIPDQGNLALRDLMIREWIVRSSADRGIQTEE